VISLRELSKNFDGKETQHRALDRVNLDVARGEIAAVIGPSGAGKSTLARCINMLERPTSGQVLVDGTDLTALRERHLREARRSIGTVFQASSLLSRRTVAQNVALPLDFLEVRKHERDARVHELLDRVGLEHRAKSYPHELSGGQKQRVGIARALALRPSVLLSDEATSGLDPATTKSVLSMLRELRDDLGLTILLITHEMDVVREVADRAALIEDGRIVEEGRLGELMRDRESALGASLLPHPTPRPAVEGEQHWQVHYVSDRVSADWITSLSSAIEAPVVLLAASIETVGDVPVGRATISVPPGDADRIHRVLAASGLHGEPVSGLNPDPPRFVAGEPELTQVA